ncbi:MAG: hypothetical protein ACI808_000580 [Paraglaciecola sp.]|jgi:hypothetical protein
MLRFTLLVYLLGLFGCQSPHVYLVAKGVEEGIVKDVKENIQNAGYEVTLAHIDIPVYFSDAAISVSPVFAKPEMLTEIQTILRRKGFAYTSVYQLAEGNHKYTKSNVGVYLRGQGYRRIPPIMSTDACDSVAATLEFSVENAFTLEIEVNSELVIFEGIYSQIGDSVQLAFSNGAKQTYFLSSTQIKTSFGYKEADLLDLLSQSTDILPARCQFVTIYG